MQGSVSEIVRFVYIRSCPHEKFYSFIITVLHSDIEESVAKLIQNFISSQHILTDVGFNFVSFASRDSLKYISNFF